MLPEWSSALLSDILDLNEQINNAAYEALVLGNSLNDFHLKKGFRMVSDLDIGLEYRSCLLAEWASKMFLEPFSKNITEHVSCRDPGTFELGLYNLRAVELVSVSRNYHH